MNTENALSSQKGYEIAQRDKLPKLLGEHYDSLNFVAVHGIFVFLPKKMRIFEI